MRFTIKKFAAKVAASFLAAHFFLAPAIGCANESAWGAAIGALGAVAAYNACFQEIISVGNNPYYQEETRRLDRKKQGYSRFSQHHETVGRVMKKLAKDGEYALEIRSLPFRWHVNDSDEFNAACYPTNFISVNRGLVDGLCGNEDEIAAVLGHEMIHGIRQHAAKNYAKAMAAMFGMTIISATTGAVDGQAMLMLTDYAIAKAVSVPTEYEADISGFYLAASAGFNPGGAAAAMVRMQEISAKRAEFYGTFDPYDHPETEEREKKLAALLTEYSANHITIEKNQIKIDGKPFLTPDWTDFDEGNDRENAYLVAGALAKAFHDCNNLSAWKWRTGEDGRPDYLTDDEVYMPLKRLTSDRRAEDELKKLVIAAYTDEVISGERTKMQKAEDNRRMAWASLKEKNRLSDEKLVMHLVNNGDAYNDVYLPELAVIETNRAFDCAYPTDTAKALAVLARAAATQGDYDLAWGRINNALKLKPDSAFSLVTRSEIHRLQGNPEEALADCRLAVKMETDFAPAWRIAGDIANELGRKEEALDFYREYKKIVRDASGIPLEYLDRLDPKSAQKIRNQKNEQAKKWAEELKKRQEKKAGNNKVTDVKEVDAKSGDARAAVISPS